MTADQRNAWLVAEDDALMRQTSAAFYRAGGPGGQHRNKVETGVRLTHRPSGVSAAATERRSQSENRRVALGRLRAALALQLRCDAPTGTALPQAVRAVLDSKRWPRLSPKAQDYWLIAAHVLDALAADEARVSDAARRLGVSTASVVKFLGSDAHLWQAAQTIRASADLPPLRR